MTQQQHASLLKGRGGALITANRWSLVFDGDELVAMRSAAEFGND
jgi:hypothetical protein